MQVACHGYVSAQSLLQFACHWCKSCVRDTSAKSQLKTAINQSFKSHMTDRSLLHRCKPQLSHWHKCHVTDTTAMSQLPEVTDASPMSRTYTRIKSQLQAPGHVSKSHVTGTSVAACQTLTLPFVEKDTVTFICNMRLAWKTCGLQLQLSTCNSCRGHMKFCLLRQYLFRVEGRGECCSQEWPFNNKLTCT